MQKIIASTTPSNPEDADAEQGFSADIEVRNGHIPLTEHGQRLDKFLVAAAPELARLVQQLIEQGAAQNQWANGEQSSL